MVAGTVPAHMDCKLPTVHQKSRLKSRLTFGLRVSLANEDFLSKEDDPFDMRLRHQFAGSVKASIPASLCSDVHQLDPLDAR